MTRTLILTLALSLSACEAPALNSDPTPEGGTDPQGAFWDVLSSHCGEDGPGRAYPGALVSSDDADADFVGRAMVMQVRECSEDRIAIPFHVQLPNEDGELEWDRSRTWLITRNEAGGLRLKHDHRHKDGEPDAVTMYGGDTADEGSALVQSFPVDAESIALFEREGLEASVTNIWTVEVAPAIAEDGVFAYQLQRTVEGGAPEDRLFRVEFDLSQEVDAPPPAWGQE